MPLVPTWAPASREITQKLTDKHRGSWQTHTRSKDAESAENVLSCIVLSPFRDFLTNGCVPLSSWVSEPKCLQVLVTRAGYTHTCTHTHTHTHTHSHPHTHKHNKHTRSKYRDGALRVHWSIWGTGMSKEGVRLSRGFSPRLHKLIPEAGWKETAERNQRKEKMKA